jgi:hypothetical protein
VIARPVAQLPVRAHHDDPSRPAVFFGELHDAFVRARREHARDTIDYLIEVL